MSIAAGIIVRFSGDRYCLFEAIVNKEKKTFFAEPVEDFNHSRNLPLICFITDLAGNISYIALGTKGNMAATGLRRLNMSEIFKLSNKVSLKKASEFFPTKLKNRFNERIYAGGLLSPKSFETLIEIIIHLAPETIPILSKYSEERRQRIKNLSNSVKSSLAQQKEAIVTAMSIAGIDRKAILGWDIKQTPSSFLDGLHNHIRAMEDQMIINDLMNFPGYKNKISTIYNSVVFTNETSKLTVVLANRLPLEQLTGTDLIYYNETFSCFTMIQYKVMEKESDDYLFRFPNNQLVKEIERMDNILHELKQCNDNKDADGYRLLDNPFFLKICPRIVFNPDNVGLVKGMYLPLDYWKLLSIHPHTEGLKGGRFISYKNVRRYFDNTEFATIVSNGWVGSNTQQSQILQKLISATLASGKAVVIAINKELDDRHRKKGTDIEVNDN